MRDAQPFVECGYETEIDLELGLKWAVGVRVRTGGEGDTQFDMAVCRFREPGIFLTCT
jgi:hypothetical protein